MTQNLRLSLLGCVLLLTSSLVSAQSSTSTPYDLFDALPASWQQGRSAVNLAVERPTDAAMVRLNTEELSALRAADLDALELTLPLPDGDRDHAVEPLTFQLERFFVHPAVVTVGMTTDRGYQEEEYVPTLQTFRLVHRDAPVGTLTLMSDHVLGSFHHNGQQYDLARVEGDVYAVLDFNKRTNLTPFECGLEEAPSDRAEAPQVQMEQRMDGGCVEVAIDVDNFTYLTYNNMSNATDWALAQMAGVSAIYTQELNGLVLLQASYVHLWQS